MSDVRLSGVFSAAADNVVAREIEGELVIVPLAAGIGDMEDDLYTLNAAGKAIWQRLDGSRTLKEIAENLALEFDAPAGEIEQDVLGLATELLNRKMIADVSAAPPAE
jgi:hypothetical protein